MKNQNSFFLIDGVFNTHDAREVLVTLIENKIRFHQLKIVSDLERFGKVDEPSENRIKQLTESKMAILKLFDEVEDDNESFVLKSEIKIERA